MCGLMAVTGLKIEQAVFEKEFEKMKYRGPDMTRIMKVQDGILGFHRLAIMGPNEKGMQPMQLHQNYSLCNGEIYNFRQLKTTLLKEYSFVSESDCEILLPLYEKYQLDMFSLLDGEFAMVIYLEKEKKWIAARDPLGIRPLFYGYLKEDHHIAFASEMKVLHELCEEVYPFPIGSYYDGEFHQYCDITKVSSYVQDSEDVICQNIHDHLINAVLKRMDSDVPIGYLLSGGLDSSLVCAIAAKHSSLPIQTFAIGMKEDAIDLAYARKVAQFIGSQHTEFLMEKEDVFNILPEVIWHLETYDVTTIRASIGMYLLCRNINETSHVKVLLSGEVSDELFGYKYTDYAPHAEAFQKESEKRLKELYEYDVLRADRCISAHGLEARVPFSDYSFAHYVMSIAPELKMNHYGVGKYLLRQSFDNQELLEEIRLREKAAFSDAVGHSMVDILKDYAHQIYTDEDLLKAQQKYHRHNPPFSKEALLYRDIFESFYPNRENLLTAYWMPNEKWPHCQVDDPSARVLPNYGTSGQ